MGRVLIAIALLVMTAWGYPWPGPRPANLSPVHLPAAPLAPPPPECVTLTPLSPLIVPSWVFVMNFDVISPTVPSPTPIGCILVFRTPGVATDFISVPCDVFGAVSFPVPGQALFAGGNVRCDVNVMNELATLHPPIALNDTAQYPYFELIGTGVLTVPAPIIDPFGNPIVYYQPLSATMPAAGLFAPAIFPDTFVMTSLFNGITNIGTVPYPQPAGSPHTWVAKHSGFVTYTVTHVLDGSVLQTYSPRQPVLFWQNGGVFWFGGTPTGPAYYGTLDEAIVDPPDSGRPPSSAYMTIVSSGGP